MLEDWVMRPGRNIFKPFPWFLDILHVTLLSLHNTWRNNSGLIFQFPMPLNHLRQNLSSFWTGKLIRGHPFSNYAKYQRFLTPSPYITHLLLKGLTIPLKWITQTLTLKKKRFSNGQVFCTSCVAYNSPHSFD